MSLSPNKDMLFFQNIEILGFEYDDEALFFADRDDKNPKVCFHIELAKKFHADAVYLRKQLNGSYKAQVYLFDFTDKNFDSQTENELTTIQKNIWSSGEAPLACVIFKTEIKIIDCTTHITKDFKPKYLLETLTITEKTHDLFNRQFALQIKSGVFWEKEDFKNRFHFRKNSAYDALIRNIQTVKTVFLHQFKDQNLPDILISKILVQSILIKYLEERVDGQGEKLLTDTYFKKYQNALSFNEVLRRKGCFSKLLKDLDRHFNGNVFKWTAEEHEQLEILDLSKVADLLGTNKIDMDSPQLEFDWRYFEFKYIPVELISRLYETFLGENKQEKGLYYTPAHLARLLVDESIPLSKHETIDPENFSILDPACGSGIFLVVAFKRLVQIWRLRHNLRRPSIDDLKKIIKSLYGIDKEEQAIQLASFSLSLALCNELEPIKIIQDLQFDDLREENLVVSDYFTCSKPVKSKKFDLVIGNPPFIRSATSNYSDFWIINGKKIEIPQKQLALKFLAEAFSNLRNNGLICLIMKSSSLLYNNTNTSTAYKKNLFLNFNVVQILDFTALAEGKSLWDNGARVGAAAIFIRNEKPDNNINVLHLIFRRAKTIKERIFFEIDDNDFHYVNRLSAVNNKYIWKINLFGGGRIKNIIAKTKSIQTLKAFLDKNNCIIEEGLKIRKSIEEDINIEDSDDKSSDYIYAIPFLPTQAISEGKIKYEMLATMDRQIKFKRLPDKNAFFAPNLIMWENIGERQFPIFFNKVSFSFKQSLISIKSLENDENILKTILKSFRAHYLFYKFYFLVTSSQTLVNRNNTFLLKDIKRIPFINCDDENIFSETDMRLMKECIHYFQNFLVHGEKSEILHHIGQEEFESTLNNYAAEFVNSLNTIYKTDKRKFRFSDLVKFDNDLIAVVFRYDTVNDDVKIHKDLGTLKIEGLTNNRISSALTSIRTIKLYPQKDMVVLVKPNQYRYWLTLAACRDADKCASDFADAGF